MDELDVILGLPPNDRYSPQAKYDDFRTLFMGSEMGQRVFREILSWGGMFRPTIQGSPIDPVRMAVREGARNMALKLLDTTNNEPKAQPEKAQRSPHG